MLTESFVAATATQNKPSQHLSTALKDVGIFYHEFQPQLTLRHGFKKSSVKPQCCAVSESHVFAAQADKAVVNVYSRQKGNQEATVPFPDRIRSLAFAEGAEILVLGTEEGKLILWETATGRLSTSASAHLQAVSLLYITSSNGYILSGSDDGTVFVWSLSTLVSVHTEDQLLNGERPANAPVRAFENHRSPVSALVAGHSRPSTNFAVSASVNQTCYVWHIDTGEILRTILLPSSPTCVTLDPVDRAIFIGDDAGAIAFVDLLSMSASMTPVDGASASPPVQVSKNELWKPTDAGVGAAHCLTLSYDGTVILSGHANGAIIHWDVAKRRMASELTNLAQPVTNIQMLKPEGLHVRRRASYVISNVVRPKLEFNARVSGGSCEIPAKYGFQASLTDSRHFDEDHLQDDDWAAITTNGWPARMLDTATRALNLDPPGFSASDEDKLADVKAGQLEDEVADLKKRLAALQAFEQRRTERRQERMLQRDEVGAKRRAAYFEAKRQGKDGDAAMKIWEEEESKIDVESDDEAREDNMDIS